MMIRLHCVAACVICLLLAANTLPAEDGAPPTIVRVVKADDLQDLETGQLLKLLDHDLAWTRIAAADVLAGRGKESVKLLRERLGDDDWRVVRAAQDGLRIMLKNMAKAEDEEDAEGDEGEKEEPQADPETRALILEAVPALKKNLENEHYYVRMGALECFRAMGADAAPAGDAICKATEDPDYLGVMPMAFKALEEVGVENFDPDQLFAMMEHSIKSPHLSARRAAFTMIRKLPEEKQRELVPALHYAMENQMLDGFTRFHMQAQIAGLLQKHDLDGTKEHIQNMLEMSGWGAAHRVAKFLPLTKKYGMDIVPWLEEYKAGNKRFEKDIQKVIDDIKKNAAKAEGKTNE